MAVENPHDTLNHRDIPPGSSPLKQLKDRCVIAEPGVQVAAGHAASQLMVRGVYVIWACLEWLDLEAAAGQSAHDAGGDRGLAHAAPYSRYYNRCRH